MGIKIISVLSILLLLSAGGCTVQQKMQTIQPGPGSFIFQKKMLNYGRPLNVLTYRPAGYRADSPVLFVIHGASRAAESYREVWAPLAEQYNALLIVPHFAREAGFPSSREFNLGNMYRLDSLDNILAVKAERNWSYSLIEPLFDFVRKKTGNRSREYYIYGHSAGSQFLHRFLFFKGKNRVKSAVCANAGWYTMPEGRVRFPYGLEGVKLNRENLPKAFNRRVTVLLGESDTDIADKDLRQTPEAIRQGRHRFERGQNFFGTCSGAAKHNGWPFNWNLQTVSGAAHSNRQMAARAAEILFTSD